MFRPVDVLRLTRSSVHIEDDETIFQASGLSAVGKECCCNLATFFLQTAASSPPFGMNSRDAGKELPRIHPIASAIRIYHPQYRTVLVYPLHFFFTNDQPYPKEITPIHCEIKPTFQREAHFHSRVTRCVIFPCRQCLAGHHYVVEFSTLLSECFSLRWCSLHIHGQANASVKSHTTCDFFCKEGDNVCEYLRGSDRVNHQPILASRMQDSLEMEM